MTRNAFRYAKDQVAGYITWEELCRLAAHNLSERLKVGQELSSNPSKPRKRYLDNSLAVLEIEKQVLSDKRDRIIDKVGSLSTEFQFII